MADYIPGPDASFQAWQSNFVTYANANLAALGLTAPDKAPITAAQAGWATAFAAHVAAVNAAKAPKQTKDEARATYVAVIGPLVRRLQASAVVNDAEKASLGITVAQTPTRKAKPAGALGVEIWNKVGTTPQRAMQTCVSSRWTPTRRT